MKARCTAQSARGELWVASCEPRGTGTGAYSYEYRAAGIADNAAMRQARANITLLLPSALNLEPSALSLQPFACPSGQFLTRKLSCDTVQ